MSKRSIVVEHLAKRYLIGGAKELGYKTLRDSLAALVRGRNPASARETIWALHDVSFAAEQGEVIGIIGRNGAGKSTLLKILSRITEPTTGRALLYGRVGSLLEVGTGFHPELTGRENIFLNGAILGMRRAEIARKLDEIVAFAEIHQFLDTPVKRYSSGMYVRLAFAVAAHLETDVLIVDEVLAVGDARFQRKCLDKMEDVGRHGRTVLFVSHNLSAVTRLCSRAVLLDRGRVAESGGASEVVRKYLRADIGTTASHRWGEASAPGNRYVRLRSMSVKDVTGAPSDRIDIRRPITLLLEWEVLLAGRVLVPTFRVINEEGTIVFVTHDLDPAWRNRMREPGVYASRVVVPGNFLSEGTFIVSVSVSTIETGEVHVSEPDVISFDVIDSVAGDSARGDYGGEMPGVVRPLLEWTTERLQ
jgi:lipopolysaccharide transport system ATP-binding protein